MTLVPSKLALVFTAVVGAGVLLASCSGPSSPFGGSASEPTETATSPPTATATATATPTITPTPTLTPTPTPTSTPTVTPTPTMTPTPTPSPTPTERAGFDVPELQRRVNEILSETTGTYSVVISTPVQGRIYELNPDLQMNAASLYKVALMVEVFDHRKFNLLTFDETIFMEPEYFAFNDEFDPLDESFIGTEQRIDFLLDAMITSSSNAAANALLARVGADQANATMQRLGLTGTTLLWTPNPDAPIPPELSDADHVTTAADMDKLYEGLLHGTVVNAQSSLEMLALLLDQQVNDRLPARLPEGTPVAHKTGNLPGFIHDAGIIYAPQGPVVVSVMTSGANEAEAVEVMAAIGEVVYLMNL